MSVSIIGPGALGTLFAARISKSGTPVQLIGRNQQALDRINTAGITFEVDGEIDTVDVRACSIEQADPTDLCVFFTKAQDLISAAESVVERMPLALLIWRLHSQ